MIKGYQEKVLKLYEQNRKQNQELLKQRRNEVYSSYPRIKDLDSSIQKTFFEITMSPFKEIPNIDTYVQRLRDKITDFKVEKSELLVSNGYPIDYIDPIYDCEKCSDTGFIGPKRCDCFYKNLVKVYYLSSELKELLLANNFSKFRFDYFDSHRFDNMDSPRRNIEKIVERSKKYIDEFKTTDDNLFFYGSPGTGKTFLTNCIAKELLDRGFLVIYKTAEELMNSIKEIKFEKNKLLLDSLINCDLLIIDDLGTEPDNDFTRTEVYNLLNKKLIKGKKMIISTNFSLEKLMQRYSERITSRLLGNFTVHKFYGEDIRIRLNLKRIQ